MPPIDNTIDASSSPLLETWESYVDNNVLFPSHKILSLNMAKFTIISHILGDFVTTFVLKIFIDSGLTKAEQKIC